MFGKRRVNQREQTLIDERTEVRGAIISRGVMEIRGRVLGDIEHDGTLLVAAGAYCTSNIRAAHLTIEGTVEGHAEVSGRLEIRKGGRLLGDSLCATFVMHAGGVLNGQNRMHAGGDGQAVADVPSGRAASSAI